MKKFCSIIILICLLVTQFICVQAAPATSNSMVAKIGEKLYFTYDEWIYSADLNMENIEIVTHVNDAAHLQADGGELFYTDEDKYIFKFNVSTGEKERLETIDGKALVGANQLIHDGKLYFRAEGYIRSYDIKTHETEDIAEMYNFLGIIDEWIYYYNCDFDNYAIELCKKSLNDGEVKSKTVEFIAAVMYEDNIYVYDAEEKVAILDADFEELRRISIDLSEHGPTMWYFSDLLTDGKYLYDCGLRINLNSGEVTFFPEDPSVIPVGDFDGWYVINLVDNELYLMEITGRDIFVINTEYNTVVKKEIKAGMIKAQVRNTFGWKLLRDKFSNFSEDEIMGRLLSSNRDYYKAITALEER